MNYGWSGAGAGVLLPHHREWRDGSRAGYGRTHLEELLESLRFVAPTQGGAEA